MATKLSAASKQRIVRKVVTSATQKAVDKDALKQAMLKLVDTCYMTLYPTEELRTACQLLIKNDLVSAATEATADNCYFGSSYEVDRETGVRQWADFLTLGKMTNTYRESCPSYLEVSLATLDVRYPHKLMKMAFERINLHPEIETACAEYNAKYKELCSGVPKKLEALRGVVAIIRDAKNLEALTVVLPEIEELAKAVLASESPVTNLPMAVNEAQIRDFMVSLSPITTVGEVA